MRGLVARYSRERLIALVSRGDAWHRTRANLFEFCDRKKRALMSSRQPDLTQRLRLLLSVCHVHDRLEKNAAGNAASKWTVMMSGTVYVVQPLLQSPFKQSDEICRIPAFSDRIVANSTSCHSLHIPASRLSMLFLSSMYLVRFKGHGKSQRERHREGNCTSPSPRFRAAFRLRMGNLS